MRCKLALLLAALLAVLSGCSLAQPEEGNGDRFAGFFVVYDSMDAVRDSFENNPNLTTYGTDTLRTQYGTYSLPQEIVVGEKQKDGQYSFGMEGRSLFLVHGSDPNGSQIFSETISDMANLQLECQDSENETANIISGTLYIGPPLDAGPEWDQFTDSGYLTFYRVYETSEGMVYLKNSGNGSVGLGSYYETHTYASALAGKKASETIKVTVNMEYKPRLEKLTVSQFDGNNTLLQSDELALREELPELECLPDTAWVLVEEESRDGTVRTAYSPPDSGEESWHTVVLLDDSGLGKAADLFIRFAHTEEDRQGG